MIDSDPRSFRVLRQRLMQQDRLMSLLDSQTDSCAEAQTNHQMEPREGQMCWGWLDRRCNVLCTAYNLYALIHASCLVMYVGIFIPVSLSSHTIDDESSRCILFTVVASCVCLVHLYYSAKYEIRDSILEVVTWALTVAGVAWSLVVWLPKWHQVHDIRWVLSIYVIANATIMFLVVIPYACVIGCSYIKHQCCTERRDPYDPPSHGLHDTAARTDNDSVCSIDSM
jgi:hypothetical protein